MVTCRAKDIPPFIVMDILERENISIARRTVAKYREMLGILPSNKRRKSSWGS